MGPLMEFHAGQRASRFTLTHWGFQNCGSFLGNPCNQTCSTMGRQGGIPFLELTAAARTASTRKPIQGVLPDIE